MPKIIEELEERITDKAFEMIINNGYKNFSIRKLASECDIAVGTIYNYFPTKHELFVRMMHDYWRGFPEKMEMIEKKNKDIYGIIRDIHNYIFQFVSTFKEYWMEDPDYAVKNRPTDKCDAFTETMIQKIQMILSKEIGTHPEKYKLVADIDELSSFIALNLIMLSRSPRLEYDSFEKILKSILEK